MSFPQPPRGPRYSTHSIMDPMHPGLVVATFDHPADWRARSMMRWNFRNHNNLAVIFAQAVSPDGTQAFETFPAENFYWSDWGGTFGGDGAYQLMVGSMAFGATARPPMRAPDVMSQIIVPKHRGNRAGLRILRMDPMPQLAPSLNQQDIMSVPHEGISVRVGYDERGLAMEEEFYACVYWLPANGGQTNWGVKPLLSLRAPMGQLEALREQCWWIAQSFRPNPHWQHTYAAIAQQLHSQQGQALYAARQQQLATDARLSAQMSDYFNWHHNLQNETAAMRAESDARRNEAFGDLMMGRTAYNDPSSATGQPAYDYRHYQYVWTDGQGHWQGSNDPSFNPNINASGNWVLARQRDQR